MLLSNEFETDAVVVAESLSESDSRKIVGDELRRGREVRHWPYGSRMFSVVVMKVFLVVIHSMCLKVQ
jgi:hypothetical protein